MCICRENNDDDDNVDVDQNKQVTIAIFKSVYQRNKALTDVHAEKCNNWMFMTFINFMSRFYFRNLIFYSV